MVLMRTHLSIHAHWDGTRWPVVLMHHHETRGCAPDGTRPATRRHVLAAAALSSFARPQPLHAASLEDPSTLEALLRASSTYTVQVDSTAKASPVANRISTGRLVGALASQRAIFLGEHHPDERDHLLQAALLGSRRPIGARLDHADQVALSEVSRVQHPSRSHK